MLSLFSDKPYLRGKAGDPTQAFRDARYTYVTQERGSFLPCCRLIYFQIEERIEKKKIVKK